MVSFESTGIVENASVTVQSTGQPSLPDQMLKRHFETTESIPEVNSAVQI